MKIDKILYKFSRHIFKAKLHSDILMGRMVLQD